jgi:hypothetical protein
MLVRNGRKAQAVLCAVPCYGYELRYSLDGELRSSQAYKTETEALEAAAAKRDELTAIGSMAGDHAGVGKLKGSVAITSASPRRCFVVRFVWPRLAG